MLNLKETGSVESFVRVMLLMALDRGRIGLEAARSDFQGGAGQWEAAGGRIENSRNCPLFAKGDRAWHGPKIELV